MANTYSQIYIHVLFAVSRRQQLLSDAWREELHLYITGIIRNRAQQLISINSVSDHMHLLIAVKPNIIISNLIRDIKNNSSRFINRKNWINKKFNWQKGFSAFSLGKSQTERAILYIKNQKEHHRQRSFQDEYLHLLKKYNIEYDERYVFDR